MFTFFAIPVLFSALTALVAGRALDVWAPPVTSPTAGSIWPKGSVQNVTWYVRVVHTMLA